jgi:type II secretory pathway predicted ATPase ExeA
MSIERLQSHYGFTRMPFGRGLAPSMLHRHPGHAEAVARITWCVDQHAIGVITGEVGAGKTVAIRAATSALDPARHVIIYLPNPSVGVRGMLHHVVGALGRVPSFYTATLAPQAAEALATEYAERGRTPVVVIDEAHLLDNAQMEAIRMLTNHDMDSGSPFAALLVGQPTLRHRLRLGVLAALDHRRLHRSPRQDRRPHGSLVLRRRDHIDPQRRPRIPQGGEQPRGARTHSSVRRQDSDRRREIRPDRRHRKWPRLNH